MVEEGKDSLTRLADDMEAVAKGMSCAYFGSQECERCRAWKDQRPCIECAFEDAARRLRALMPHDADGREIEVGDTIESTFGTQVHVTDVVALPVNVHDGVVYQFPVALLHLWRVVEPDSWEKLEQDAAKRVCEYAGAQKSIDDDEYTCINCPYYEPGPHIDKGCQERMRLDLVRRAKALAKAGDGE